MMEHNLVPVFAALAHPQRLQIMHLLVRQHPAPVAAGAIGARLGLKPSTLSGYLAQLVETGLIAQERRGTSLLYSIVPEALAGFNTAWIGDLCQGRGLPELSAAGPRIRNLLFVDHQNSTASLMAEAAFRTLAGERFEVFSAGLHAASEPDPEVLAMLEEQGFQAGVLWSKSLDLFTGPDAPVMDIVITLGEVAAEDLPALSGYPVHGRWQLPEASAPVDTVRLLLARLRALWEIDPTSASRAEIQEIVDFHCDTVLQTA
ncbi:metalloregulator ArsR/SmtB family transcription factor [Pararhodobacter oceanensis]|nr:metalloregulator ArsR/SmtB family transcription factor [Pararhodobacter oceanensis]